MNYKVIYDSMINKRIKNPIKNGIYSEKHHIIPACLGGENSHTNLIKLSAREHFIAHLLLCKIHEKDQYIYPKMLKAFMMMLYCQSEEQKRFISSREYAKLKERFSKIRSLETSGKKNPNFGNRWIHHITTKEAKRISKKEEIPNGWAEGRIPKECITKSGRYYSKNSKEYIKRQRDKLSKHKRLVNFRVKYCKYLLEFANGDYSSIIQFTTTKKISKNNEPLNRTWNTFFPKISNYKKSTLGFSSSQAKKFLNDFKIFNLKDLYHFILVTQHEGGAVGLHPKG